MSTERSSTDASISKATAVTSATSTASINNKATTATSQNYNFEYSLEETVWKGGNHNDDDDDSNAAAVAGDGSIGYGVFDEDDIPDYTPPLRIHAFKHASGEQPRLTGSQSQLQGVPTSRELLHMKRRKSDPSNPINTVVSSRSGSESPGSRSSRGGYHRHHGSGTSGFDGGSSISSLEDAGIDIDILTDKMGVLELDFKAQQEITQSLNRSLSNLPAVNERLCDETLDDVHAFSDVRGRETTGGTLSRGGSITTGGEVSSNVLEPLEEIDEQDDDSAEGERIKITNLAEILEAPDEDEHAVGDATGSTGAVH